MIYLRRSSSETRKKILTACVRLFLEQGYKNTSVSQIVDEAGVARGSYLNLFPAKDKILLDLTETMFGGQFGVARSIAGSKLPSVYAYAVDTAIQLTLTELNENLREIYIEAYTAPDTAEYIYVHTTAELKEIFGGNFPDYSDSDFYEIDIGTAGLMRSYMARNATSISRWNASSAAFSRRHCECTRCRRRSRPRCLPLFRHWISRRLPQRLCISCLQCWK